MLGIFLVLGMLFGDGRGIVIPRLPEVILVGDTTLASVDRGGGWDFELAAVGGPLTWDAFVALALALSSKLDTVGAKLATDGLRLEEEDTVVDGVDTAGVAVELCGFVACNVTPVPFELLANTDEDAAKLCTADNCAGVRPPV